MGDAFGIGKSNYPHIFEFSCRSFMKSALYENTIFEQDYTALPCLIFHLN